MDRKALNDDVKVKVDTSHIKTNLVLDHLEQTFQKNSGTQGCNLRVPLFISCNCNNYNNYSPWSSSHSLSDSLRLVICKELLKTEITSLWYRNSFKVAAVVAGCPNLWERELKLNIPADVLIQISTIQHLSGHFMSAVYVLCGWKWAVWERGHIIQGCFMSLRWIIRSCLLPDWCKLHWGNFNRRCFCCVCINSRICIMPTYASANESVEGMERSLFDKFVIFVFTHERAQ